ncbi:MAG: VOC family protein [Pseudomonadota bacterium]
MSETNHGHFNWNELTTRDMEASKAFYASVFGWTYTEMEDPESPHPYVLAMDGDVPVAGLFNIDGEQFEGMPTCWTPYIASENVDSSVEKTTAAGGRIVRPAWEVPGVGRIAIVADCCGVVSGYITPASQE